MPLSVKLEGDGNAYAGRDIVVQLPLRDQADVLKHMFAAADGRFRSEVSESGAVLRLSSSVEYSSEALFSSLMQIGLPADVALRVPLQIVPFLRNKTDERGPDEPISTADIRVAVVQVLEELGATGMFPEETVSMWATAYIRRYGNPDHDFVKVIDHGTERDLNYEFIDELLLPHLLARVLGLPRDSNVPVQFSKVFSKSRLQAMAKIVMTTVNSLNLYSIRYRTLLLLMQDLILEPPHPWIVTKATRERGVAYNLERMEQHYGKIRDERAPSQLAVLQHVYYEYFRHACAAVLSTYGAFLGVGTQYGLLELVRILKLRRTNPALWSYCRIHDIESDLDHFGWNAARLLKETERVHQILSCPSQNGRHLIDLASAVEALHALVPALCRFVGNNRADT